jgi:cholinesterase
MYLQYLAVGVAIGLTVNPVHGMPKNPCKPGPHALMTVKTTNGKVTGHFAAGSATVLEYLGVPYARPPVGDLRFAPPQRLEAAEDYEAKDFVSQGFLSGRG